MTLMWLMRQKTCLELATTMKNYIMQSFLQMVTTPDGSIKITRATMLKSSTTRRTRNIMVESMQNTFKSITRPNLITNMTPMMLSRSSPMI
jgi:hypothetical protein